MSRIRWIALTLAAIPFASVIASEQSAPPSTAALDFFEKKIRPVLVANCFNCHSANTNSRGGLRVDDRNGLTVGGGRGPAVIPGDPDKSLLMQAVRHTHAKLKMPLPPAKQLSAEEIADLATWIKDGAAWPQPRVPASIGRPNKEYEKLRKEHWAFQPIEEQAWRAELRKQPVDASWARDDIDRLILGRLEAKQLKPVADADAHTLIRRLTFDLTGLPPTVEAVKEFVTAWETAGAKRQAVVEKTVDRLLASPQFGERWGRHWLDIARFGESTGSARNLPFPHAWRYRDYVIDAFNADMPYDQFLREQIAGDLLPAKSQTDRDRQVIATGFLAIGVQDVNQRFKVRFIMDNIDEQIDTVTRSVLALTASCARCHDHKFDPIPTTDYYALAGIFQSSDLCAGLRNKMGGGGLDYYDPTMLLRIGGESKADPKLAAKIEAAKAALANARAELDALMNDPTIAKAGAEREKKLIAARTNVKTVQANMIKLTDSAANGQVAFGVRDGKKIADTEVRIRGEAEKLGPIVPRGYLSAVHVPGAPKINPEQSGRLELAYYLSSPKNPLTARVMANRVWKHLFGAGIVGSVDNFGVTGDKPSHPELLDHLAARFIDKGWSVKKLVRTVVLTRAYQLSSNVPAAAEHDYMKVDPGNQFVWRHNPRRLSAEEIRDAMLSVAGKLDSTRPNGSSAMNLQVMELTNVSPLAKKIEEDGKKSVHRSVYLPLLRTLTPRALEVFDFAEQGMVTGSRDTTTVATQALYLLNDPFVRQQSLSLADRSQKTAKDDRDRVQFVYQLTLSRAATSEEIERALGYIGDYETAARDDGASMPRVAAWASFCQAVLASAEFRYIK